MIAGAKLLKNLKGMRPYNIIILLLFFAFGFFVQYSILSELSKIIEEQNKTLGLLQKQNERLIIKLNSNKENL